MTGVYKLMRRTEDLDCFASAYDVTYENLPEVSDWLTNLGVHNEVRQDRGIAILDHGIPGVYARMALPGDVVLFLTDSSKVSVRTKHNVAQQYEVAGI